jgi:Spy/CpxP family protein refolding chaperone
MPSGPGEQLRMRKLSILAAAAILALAAQAQAGPYHAPKTGFGQPDLQGTWTNASLTQLQRPAMFKSLTLTDAEAAAVEKRRAAARANADKPTDPNSGAPPARSLPSITKF